MITERVPVVEKIFGANDRLAADNHARLEAAGVFSLNFMASPGAGKTSLIEQTVRHLSGQLRLAVVDGDIATSLDADRAAAAGAVAVQINTGGDCHLDAAMLQSALDELDLSVIDLLIVENVGNLVCPANFSLGTHKSVLVASVPEGDDKPYKYPGAYRGVQALVINKIDLLPYVNFDMEYFQRGASALNPGLATIPVSCRTGDGLDAWLEWVVEQVSTNGRGHEIRRI
ncbi:MAG: hydrogenase nickel incorporation protein HypB [Anaerolineae bacterium]|uniref:hydrogenase nickel incorporation protein HypB n=1 Tax=Promineifilum sp. TaxID=2664178 RepID=UPI0024120592|nr:hydrogenase nickel incorporation protein HypB [Promineifilum sp.]MCO5179777.1 hydrogenase nickel incorporation protein HypB [Promineifilum sp.]MCW5845663.1 hydrogenase nickel incorporation protein HypB [Anaerolineae bacterium]